MPTATTNNNSTIVVRVSGDHYKGAPQFQLMVDGKPVGAVQTVTAVHGKDQWQDFTFKGNFGADGAGKVEVVFLNDAFAGAGKDRNLWVDRITVDGKAYQSEFHADYDRLNLADLPGREKMAQAGRLVFDVDGGAPAQPGGSAPPISKPAPGGGTSTPAPSGDDTIVVRVSGDHYQGAPQFQLMVDGKAVGDVKTVTAVHGKGQWQEFAFKGEFDGTEKVEVVYLNDAFAGKGKDRNLYVDQIAVDGKVYQSETHADYEFAKGTLSGREKMSQKGAMVFDLGNGGSAPSTPPTPAPSGDDTIVVRVSGDHYQGAPQFQLVVDGEAVGATQTVTAVRGKGQWQNVTFKGDFDDADKIEVVYLNDRTGSTGDRNLHVDKITVDGTVYQAETKGVYDRASGADVTGTQKMNVAGKMVFDMSDSDPTPAPTPTPPQKPSPGGGSGGKGPGASGEFTVGDDGRIYDPQGHVFEVHGANLFPNQSGSQFVKAIDAWNLNALRLNFVPDMWTEAQLDKAIDTYTAQGIVVIPTWQETAGYMDGAGERQAIVEFFSRLATKYNDNPYVWYGGYNEPGNAKVDSMYVNGEWVWDPKSVDKWVDLSRDVIDAVRDAGATSPVLVASMMQGQDILRSHTYNPQWGKPLEEISAILAHGDRVLKGFDNIAFDVHIYGNYNVNNGLKYLDMFLDEAEERGLAIIFGEYGGTIGDGWNGVPSTIQATRNMAELRDEHNFGDMVWHAQSSGKHDVTTSGVGGILNTNNLTNPTNLTELGEIVWEGTH